MTTHARLSPSRAHRWSKCAASVNAEARYEDTSGEAAIDGTKTHALLEQCITYGHKNADVFEGKRICWNSSGEGFIVESGRVERVNIALNYIQQVKESHNYMCMVISECKVSAEEYTGRTDMHGTADIIIVSKDSIEVIDYKDGFTEVKPDCEQLRLYLLGALAKFKDRIFSKVTLTVIQPRSAVQALSQIRSVEVNSAGIAHDMVFFKEAAEATDREDAPFVAGEHCKYCKHAGNCAELNNHGLQKLTTSIESLDLELAQANPLELSDERLVEIIEAAPLIRVLLENSEKEAYRRMMEGRPITGLKLVKGKGSRKWNLTEEDLVPKLVKAGIPKKDLYLSNMVSPAQLEKLTWTNKKGESKRVTARQMELIEREYITTIEGKPKVALDSDSRQVITANASSLFSSIE